MNPKTVITIGRQLGAGGHEVGRLLARRAGLPFYDEELIRMAANDSGLAKELLEQHDEKPAEPLPFSAWTNPFSPGEPPIGQKTFMAQFKTIQKLAEAGGAVIVGRCADFVLRDRPNVVRVFLHAPLEARVERILARSDLDGKEAKLRIKQAEKNRKAYYNYFTDRTWGATETYDLCINTALVGTEAAVDTILLYAESASR